MENPPGEEMKGQDSKIELASSGTIFGRLKRTGSTKRRRSTDQKSSHAEPLVEPGLYINRELSWLEFNQRVLQEACDQRHPLLERVKFLSIVSTNLDEFFMIRVAGIKELILADIVEYSPDGLTPSQQLHAVHDRVSVMLKEMCDCYRKDLLPNLAAQGIYIVKMDELTVEDRKKLGDLFAREIYPVLTPLAFDPGHPFPYISNLSLSLAVVVKTPNGEERFARVKVPDVLPRIVQIPNGGSHDLEKVWRFVWLEDVIANNLNLLFPGMTVEESYAFRVTRNADMEIQEDEADDLIQSIEESIRQRRFGSVVRVSIENKMPARIKDILIENLEVTPDDVYELDPPLDPSQLMTLLKLPRPELKDPTYVPVSFMAEEDGEDILSSIRRGDILLHHPYDSFNPIVQFIRSAANDPNVLAIKQTLYRIGKESPLIPLFVEAAEKGKQVAVLVELKARFDEENNIGWAKQLERAGVHVVYGLVGLKTHAKMALVVRRENDGLRRYVHLGTGNYNTITARIYTDLSYFTCREDITEDITEVFNYLTGYSRRDSYKKLAVAPVTLRQKVESLIDREIRNAQNGKPGHMILKMNALTDVKMIAKIYEASKAGVKIDLIVRGICSLRPGVKGISETIRVVSIVGRYLEHSRVFYFYNAGQPELYLSSADLMGRNLERRVELMFPVEDESLAIKIREEVLDTALADSLRARELKSDGSYALISAQNGKVSYDLQEKTMLSRTEAAHTQKPVMREAPLESST
ncbi:MAG TPA: polyphosphate kinase 1 [Candidatus Acidoferrales bacterium]|nr:polyphosphate kinase 1 [Candidatus Acidoferrales bacterium]